MFLCTHHTTLFFSIIKFNVIVFVKTTRIFPNLTFSYLAVINELNNLVQRMLCCSCECFKLAPCLCWWQSPAGIVHGHMYCAGGVLPHHCILTQVFILVQHWWQAQSMFGYTWYVLLTPVSGHSLASFNHNEILCKELHFIFYQFSQARLFIACI